MSYAESLRGDEENLTETLIRDARKSRPDFFFKNVDALTSLDQATMRVLLEEKTRQNPKAAAQFVEMNPNAHGAFVLSVLKTMDAEANRSKETRVITGEFQTQPTVSLQEERATA